MKWLAVAAVLAARPVFADDAARAKAADRSARAHYAAHEYDAAIADYQAAYRAMPEPLFLFDIAQAYRQLHDCDHALELYREYLHLLPRADNHQLVERFVDEMTACSTPEPEPELDAVEPAPARSTPPPPPAGTPPFSTRTIRLAGITSAALGAVLIGTAVYFSNQASEESEALETACARGCSGASVAGIDSAGRDADHDAIATYVLGGAALAAGAAAIVWTVFRAPGEPPVVAPTSGGATVSATIHF